MENSIHPGMTLFNKYHILKPIGEGGMARVWLAEEIAFGRRLVALKEPRTDLPPIDQDDVQRRFHQEVTVCAALEGAKARHIVRTFTAEPYEKKLLLVMAYMPGKDLAQRIAAHPQGMPIDEVIAIGRALLTALQAAHEHPMEIVHRDLKPSNVLFDEKGIAHLADFGLAQIAGHSGRSQLKGGAHPGSPLYMAPEQASSTGYLTPAADIFALGCILFEMVTGKRYKRMRPGTRASQIKVGVPSWLDDLLARALTEDPFDRYESAEEMRGVLIEQMRTQANQIIIETQVSEAKQVSTRSSELAMTNLEPVSDRAAEAAQQELAVQDTSAEVTLTEANSYFERGKRYRQLGEDLFKKYEGMRFVRIPAEYGSLPSKIAQIRYGRSDEHRKREEEKEDFKARALAALEAAIQDFTAAIDRDPHNSSHYYERGLAYSIQGQGWGSPQAFEDFSKAIELDPNISTYYFQRGLVYMTSRGNPFLDGGNAADADTDTDEITYYTSALKDLCKAIELDDTNAQYYFERGRCYDLALFDGQANGDQIRATADFNRAIELDPNNPQYQQYIASRLTASKKTEEIVNTKADHSRTKRLQGTVKWWRNDKGYGFIVSDDGKDVFVHHSAIQMQGFVTLHEGQRVEFSMSSTDKGLQAFDVKPL